MIKLLILSAVLFAVGFYVGKRHALKAHQKDFRGLAYYRSTYLSKQGGTVLIPNASSYHLLSIDGGKNWLALSPDRQVLGPAEQVHPGLVKHLEAMEKAVALARPLDLQTEDDRRLLQDMGFSIGHN